MMSVARRGWPGGEAEFPWAVYGLEGEAITAAIFSYLAHHEWSEESEEELLSELRRYTSIDADDLRCYVECLTGRAGRQWSPRDVDFEAIPQPPDVRGQQLPDDEETSRRCRNLFELSVEFVGYAHREEGMPYTRAEQGRRHLEEYLLERAAGNLGPSFSMMDRMLRPQLIERTPDTPPPEHVLCPDARTLDPFLGGLSGLFEPSYYRIAATLAVIPAWLRFLQSRGLIDADRQQQSLAEIQPLVAGTTGIWAGFREDPTLAAMMARWPDVPATSDEHTASGP